MPTRQAFSNFIFTLITLSIMVVVGMLLKARYRLPSEMPAIKAIPVAQAVEDPPVAEPRAYKSGDFWVLSSPKLGKSRGMEADTLRVTSGTKEDVFVLYFVDAAEASWSHPKKIAAQAEQFNQILPQKLVEGGQSALAYVQKTLSEHPFKIYTKWGRVPDTERFYGLVSVEIEPGKTVDLGDLLVSKGFALPTGLTTAAMPAEMKTSIDHTKELQKSLALAKAERRGIWSISH